MLTRRKVLKGSLLLGGCVSAGMRPVWASSEEALSAQLGTLPGKKPLIRRSFRPPNFETPLADLRQPFTANDAFFVRYHLAVIPEVDPRTWRLEVSGAQQPRNLTPNPSGYHHNAIQWLKLKVA